MKLAVTELKSASAYSQSRKYDIPKLPKELPKAYEERTWRERCHVTENDQIFIPPMAFANTLKEAAKYLSIQIPGMGKSTYTKHFESGVMVVDPLLLPITKDNVKGEWLFVPSDGKRGGGRRVDKCFPVIPQWQGKVTWYIFDDIITEDIFRQVLETAGNIIGIGRFRPRNMGYYGRFTVEGKIQFGSV